MNAKPIRETTEAPAGRQGRQDDRQKDRDDGRGATRVWVAWAIYFGVLCAVAVATLRGAA